MKFRLQSFVKRFLLTFWGALVVRYNILNLVTYCELPCSPQQKFAEENVYKQTLSQNHMLSYTVTKYKQITKKIHAFDCIVKGLYIRV